MAEIIHNQPLVSVIIPAYNEGQTIRGVAAIFVAHPQVAEVLVIDDGSSDNSVSEAKEAGATVIVMEKNGGKGRAMDAGVAIARGDYIFFADADLIGMNARIVDTLIAKALNERYGMFTAVRGRKTPFLNRILPSLPILGGERIITRELWSMVPEKYKRNFEIETALNYYVRKNNMKVGCQVFPELNQVIKEKKRGLLLGLWQRVNMIKDVAKAMFMVWRAR